MALPGELEREAVVDDSLPLQALADPGAHQQVDRPLLQYSRADAVLDVVAASGLQHDRLDALDLEQPREREPGRAGADDADLGPRGLHADSPSSSTTRWKTAKALFAAGTPQ